MTPFAATALTSSITGLSGFFLGRHFSRGIFQRRIEAAETERDRFQKCEEHTLDLFRLQQERYETEQREAAACFTYQRGWARLIEEFKARALARSGQGDDPPALWSNANEVRKSLRDFKVQRGIPLDHADLPIEAPKALTGPNHWRDLFIPGDLTDPRCPPWEMIHLPTSGRLTVGHLQEADAEHWAFEARVAPPSMIDDMGHISPEQFERECLHFRRVIPYIAIPERNHQRACQVAKVWYRRMLLGPTRTC